MKNNQINYDLELRENLDRAFVYSSLAVLDLFAGVTLIYNEHNLFGTIALGVAGALTGLATYHLKKAYNVDNRLSESEIIAREIDEFAGYPNNEDYYGLDRLIEDDFYHNNLSKTLH